VKNKDALMYKKKINEKSWKENERKLSKDAQEKKN
jgi:hypothetical protein